MFRAGAALLALWLAWASAAWAQPAFGLGVAQLPQPGGGTVAVFYPASASEAPVVQGPSRCRWPGRGRWHVATAA